MTLIYDRKLKETYTEAEVGGRVVTFLYETALGRFLLKPLLYDLLLVPFQKQKRL